MGEWVGSNGARGQLQMWIGIGVTFMSLCYLGWATSYSSFCNCCDGQEAPERERLVNNQKGRPASYGVDDSAPADTEKGPPGPVDDVDIDDDDQDGREHVPSVRTQNRDFHILMTLASCYMAMLFSNWGDITSCLPGDENCCNSDDSDNCNEDLTYGGVNLWVNIIALWTASALYLYALIVPQLCPSRDFSG